MPEMEKVADLDGTVDAADWISVGHVLDAYEVEYIRSLYLYPINGREVFVIQDEMGDVIDVTLSQEWAEHQTRNDDETPLRTLTRDTLWFGPENREDWNA